MSRTLRNYLAVSGRGSASRRVQDSDAVGIELELEMPRRYDMYDLIPPEGWTIHEDGSLRNGVEFITEPTSDYARVLQNMQEYLNREDHFLISERCSVHVHLNMLDMTAEEILNFILLYTAFERVLNVIAGGRDTNTYCLSVYQARDDYIDLVRHIRQSMVLDNSWGWMTAGRSDRRNRRRYSALSLVRIGEIGTAEIRTHEGTLDMAKVTRWVDYLCALRKAAREIHTEFLLENLNDPPNEVFNQVFEDKLENLLADYFGDLIQTEENLDILYDSYRKGYYLATGLLQSPELNFRQIMNLENV